MRKFTITLILLLLLFPKLQYAQKGESVAAAAAGILAVGGAIAAIEQLKENLEQKAVEQVLSAYPYLENFELKSRSLDGTKAKDLSAVGVLTFEITNLENQEKFVLFAFTSNGWANEYGIENSKLLWKNFNKREWNNLMKAYVMTASGESMSDEEISRSKIVNKGVKIGSRFIIQFDKIGGDVYLTNDYSNEFKIVFNEKSLGIFLKETSDLVQIRRKAIIKAHEHLNEN
ncbi:hypothetical protein DEJ39_04075 [Bacteroidetes bacterium SCGC AAA795-G10]|nr:hypothetical protein DEJ39_04075 [Bacteroidetes bacterium SCGC AAA795-G10]